MRILSSAAFVLMIVISSAGFAVGECSNIFETGAELSVTSDSYSVRVSMPSEAKVSDLIDAEGNIWLFRVNVGSYKVGAHGPYTQKEGGISTSLNPDIASLWGLEKKGETTYIFLIRQNVFTDELFYPGKGGFRVSAPKLTAETKRSDIAFYDEVKVRTTNFNVVAQIPIDRFNNVLRNLEGKKFRVQNLVEILLDHPHTTLINTIASDQLN